MPISRHRKLYGVLGLRLANARGEAGLTQEEVGRTLEYDQTTVSRIETGDRRVDVFELREFAKLYGVPMESLTRPPTAAEIAASKRVRRERRSRL